MQLKDMIVAGDCLGWLRGLPDHYAEVARLRITAIQEKLCKS